MNTVDDVDVVRGYAFQFVGDQLELVAGTGGVLPVPTSIGPVAAAALSTPTPAMTPRSPLRCRILRRA